MIRVDAFGAIVPPAGSIKFGPGQIHTLPGGGQIHFYPGGGGHFWPGPGGYNPQPVPVPPSFQQQLSQFVISIYRAWDDGTLCGIQPSPGNLIGQFQSAYNAWMASTQGNLLKTLPLAITGVYDSTTSSSMAYVIGALGMDQGQSAISAPPACGPTFGKDQSYGP